MERCDWRHPGWEWDEKTQTYVRFHHKVGDRSIELNKRYNACCDAIDICCDAICMGVNVEQNRETVGKMRKEIRTIRSEAEQLGITLVRDK